MTYNIHTYTKKYLPLLMVVLSIAGCGGTDSSKRELEELNKKHAEQQERLKVAQANAHHAFKNGIGSLVFMDPQRPQHLKTTVTSNILAIGEKSNLPNFISLNKEIQRLVYEDGNKSKRKGARGALAAFFYPLFDKLFDGDTDNQMYASLLRIILECKEAMEQLIAKPGDYTPEKLEKILKECQQKMKAAPELKIVSHTVNGQQKHLLQKESSGTPQNYYDKPGVKDAFEAFKKKIAALQAEYEKVIGLRQATAKKAA